MLDEYLSTVSAAPVSYAVYSSFSFYARPRGGELSGPWLVAALGDLGHSPAAVRQTLYRMQAQEELEARREGRTKWYRLSPFAAAVADAGLAKILERPEPDWDGMWTLVQFRFASGRRVERDRMRDILVHEGFAQLGPGVYVHPRGRGRRVQRAAAAEDLESALCIFRGMRLHGESERDFVASLWDLDELSSRYRAFIDRYEPLLDAGTELDGDFAGFVLRFAVVFDFLGVAWDDPELPPSLLPADWQGARAQALARELYLQLLPRAIAHADAIDSGGRPRTSSDRSPATTA